MFPETLPLPLPKTPSPRFSSLDGGKESIKRPRSVHRQSVATVYLTEAGPGQAYLVAAGGWSSREDDADPARPVVVLLLTVVIAAHHPLDGVADDVDKLALGLLVDVETIPVVGNQTGAGRLENVADGWLIGDSLFQFLVDIGNGVGNRRVFEHFIESDGR